MAAQRRFVGGLVGAVAIAASVLVAVGHVEVRAPDVALHAYVYGVGGRGDGTGAKLAKKLTGKMIYDNAVYRVVDPGTDVYQPIVYPASLPVDPSVADAILKLDAAVRATPAGTPTVVVGYSEGAIAAEYLRRQYHDDPTAPPPGGLSFLVLAAPQVPNGGIYARFTRGIMPGFTTTGPAQETRYDTTYVSVEFDTIADFPAYFNPLAIANSLVAFPYSHGDEPYDAADPNDPDFLVKTVPNSEGGTDTYIFIPVDNLPLLQPVRDISRLISATALTEPILGAIEPVLRVTVDMGYTDRVNANPDKHVPFSLFTPRERVVESVRALPDAVAEGGSNFRAGVQNLVHDRRGSAEPSQLRLAEPDVEEAAVAPKKSKLFGDRLLRSKSAESDQPETEKVKRHPGGKMRDSINGAVRDVKQSFKPGKNTDGPKRHRTSDRKDHQDRDTQRSAA